MASINTNVSSLNSQRQLMKTNDMLGTALQRLSSGVRINSAKDDAAGLAIATRMTSQINGLNQAARNANDAISLSQTAEGALSTMTDALQRMRTLAIQSANDTNSASDRANLQKEVSQLQQEITRIATTTEFNGKKLFDGSFAGQYFQIGANASQTLGVSLSNNKASNLGAYTLAGSGTGATAVAAAAGAGAKVANAVAAGEDLAISGSLGSANVTVNAADDGYTIAQRVNAATASTGVSAQAKTQATLGNLSGAGSATITSMTLYGSNTTGVTLTNIGVASTTDLSGLADAINNVAAQTGITATHANGTITLKSDEGYDIGITDLAISGTRTMDLTGQNAFTSANVGAAATLGAAVGTDSSTVASTFKFTSSEAFNVTSGAAGVILNGTTAQNGSLSAVNSISVATQAGSNAAIDILDSALQSVNNQRATLGALQNRVTSTISNLQTVSENLQASRSRIQDTDFAEETANLTRAQILQQAGTAMLAQANQLPNGVLQLLRG
jgi:flagellin